MSYVVYKYPVAPWKTNGKIRIQVPLGSEFLDFKAQGEHFFVWYLVPCRQELVNYCYQMLMTGEEIKGYPGHYMGTAENSRGIVAHLFGIACEEA